MGLIPVKNLLKVDPKDAVPFRKMIKRTNPRVSENMPLYDILNEFQKGHSHIAVVYRDLSDSKRSQKKTKEDFENEATMELDDSNTVWVKNEEERKKSVPPTPAFEKRHRGCSFCILDLDNSPIPKVPPNQEFVGVITTEDVIEELFTYLIIIN